MPAPEPGPVLDLSEPRRIHVVGVGGAGHERVRGDPRGDGPHRQRLGPARAHPPRPVAPARRRVPRARRSPQNVPPDADAVVISSAVPRTNVEVVAAEAAGLPVLSRADALAGIVGARRGLGVAGTHGKTTTTSMITLIMRAAGLHPSFLVGSELNEVGTNAGLDSGEWLIVEADESDGTFLRLGLEAAIVTNIDHDHLWYWGDMARLEDAFRRFVDAVEGPVVLCADDPEHPARSRRPGRTRSRTAGPRTRATGRSSTWAGAAARRSCSSATASGSARSACPVVGRHNAQNAAGAAAMTLELGVRLRGGPARARRLRRCRPAVPAPRRARRRHDRSTTTRSCRRRSRPRSAPPREGDWRRIIAVFQPFRYARTELMWREFADAFVGADQVILTDVCGFHEQPIPGRDRSPHRERGARRAPRASRSRTSRTGPSS